MIPGTHSERRGDVTVLRPVGSMDGRNARDALDMVRAEIEEGHRKFVVDLGEVEFIDSSGLGTLVRMLRAAEEAGGGLRLARPTERVRGVLEATLLDSVFRSHDNVEEALASLAPTAE